MLDLSQYKPGDKVTVSAVVASRVYGLGLHIEIASVGVHDRVGAYISPDAILYIAPATDAPETGDERKGVGFGDVPVSPKPTYDELVEALIAAEDELWSDGSHAPTAIRHRVRDVLHKAGC
jgi:hypothetical protein